MQNYAGNTRKMLKRFRFIESMLKGHDAATCPLCKSPLVLVSSSKLPGRLELRNHLLCERGHFSMSFHFVYDLEQYESFE